MGGVAELLGTIRVKRDEWMFWTVVVGSYVGIFGSGVGIGLYLAGWR